MRKHWAFLIQRPTRTRFEGGIRIKKDTNLRFGALLSEFGDQWITSEASNPVRNSEAKNRPEQGSKEGSESKKTQISDLGPRFRNSVTNGSRAKRVIQFVIARQRTDPNKVRRRDQNQKRHKSPIWGLAFGIR